MSYRTIALCLFAYLAISIPATILVFGQASAQSKAPELSKKDQEEKNQATTQIKSAYEKVKGMANFKAASDKKNFNEMGAILLRAGAPDGTIVTGSNGASGIVIECCSKKPWGPIIIRI